MCFVVLFLSFVLVLFPKLTVSRLFLQLLRSITSQIKLELCVVVNQEIVAALRVEGSSHYCQPPRTKILLHAPLMFQLHVLTSLWYYLYNGFVLATRFVLHVEPKGKSLAEHSLYYVE